MRGTRLHDFGAGRSGRIVEVALSDPMLTARLAHFGLVPGALVEVEQAWPAAVVRLGETTLALDDAIAASIYVHAIE